MCILKRYYPSLFIDFAFDLEFSKMWKKHMSHSVHLPLPLSAGRRLGLRSNFQKGGLTESIFLEGGCWERRGGVLAKKRGVVFLMRGDWYSNAHYESDKIRIIDLHLSVKCHSSTRIFHTFLIHQNAKIMHEVIIYFIARKTTGNILLIKVVIRWNSVMFQIHTASCIVY